MEIFTLSDCVDAKLGLFCLWPNRKRNKVQEQLEKNRPYIKKPLNAFMVFMREQRPHIDEEVKRKGNGVVNMHLAQKVDTSVWDSQTYSSMFLLGSNLYILSYRILIDKWITHPNDITLLWGFKTPSLAKSILMQPKENMSTTVITGSARFATVEDDD